MLTWHGWICAVLMGLLLAGCAQKQQGVSDGNHTIALQCGIASPLALKVSGSAYVDLEDLAASNCSVHAAQGITTVRCPRVELSVSPSAK